MFDRSSGILLHPTSMPGRFGIGELGAPAYEFVDFLAASKQRLWQVLPLGPTGYGDSPYQSFSACAGNHLLISLDELVKEGALAPADLEQRPRFPAERVDYGAVIEFKRSVLRRSFERFREVASRAQQAEFTQFCETNDHWLDDYSLFMALKDNFDGAPWNHWDQDIARRERDAVERWAGKLRNEVRFHQYLQFQFFRQWSAVKRYASGAGIKIVGDIPIFVAYDSADVWANPQLFFLDEGGAPTVVAGVPPDYFSETGQLWGNPIYRWDLMADNGYAWWINRFRTTFEQVDIVRLDHFRGFEAYWEVPAGEETAINGRWIKGPAEKFFHAVEDELGKLPLIAEDLGVITPEVTALRKSFGFPGMKILQFAFNGDNGSDYLPHNYERNYVAYTGTHDNDTTRGWFESASDAERDFVLKYVGTDGEEIHWDLIRLAFSSVANMAIVPLQDPLGLGTEARMNFPSRARGNWSWRYTAGMLTDDIAGRLATLSRVYGRAES